MGWTWEQVETQIDLHRYAALQRQWRRSPPLQAMAQAWLGIEPQLDPDPSAKPVSEEEALQTFINNFAAAGGIVH